MRPSVHFALWLVGLRHAETQTTEAERACLARHIAGKRTAVEIGSWHGVSTRVMRAAMSSDGTLYAVDPYPVGRLGFSFQKIIAQSEVRKSSNGSVRWVRETGKNAARDHARRGAPVDFIFIDGDHSYQGLKSDWEAWSDLMADEGIIALHDSRSTPTRAIEDAGSVQFTRDVVMKDPRFELVDAVDSLSVLRRKKTA